MKAPGVRLLILLLSLTLGCEFVRPTMNSPLPEWDPLHGYRFANLPASVGGNTDSLFIVASFSGGGARASALSYGVLRELARTPIVWEGYRKRLLDELTIINALSGGSFTAAYYALYHGSCKNPLDLEHQQRQSVTERCLAESTWSSQYSSGRHR